MPLFDKEPYPILSSQEFFRKVAYVGRYMMYRSEHAEFEFESQEAIDEVLRQFSLMHGTSRRDLTSFYSYNIEVYYTGEVIFGFSSSNWKAVAWCAEIVSFLPSEHLAILTK